MRTASTDVRGSAQPLVSVVIPYMDTPDALDCCVASLTREWGSLPHELIVVDNGSRSETVPRQLHVHDSRVLRNRSNRGFAAACNQGAAVASGRYLFFLNTDTAVAPRTIARLAEVMERDPGLAGVAPIHIDSAGRAASPGRTWLGPMKQALGLLGGKHARSTRPVPVVPVEPVSWLSGAALLVRARVFRLVGGFDEGYFFYEEDEDLAWRFACRGYRVAVCADATVAHVGGLTADAAGPWPTLSLYAGQLRFVRRRWGRGGAWLYRASTAAAIVAKAAKAALLGHPSRTLARVAPSRVLRLLCSRQTQARIAEE